MKFSKQKDQVPEKEKSNVQRVHGRKFQNRKHYKYKKYNVYQQDKYKDTSRWPHSETTDQNRRGDKSSREKKEIIPEKAAELKYKGNDDNEIISKY